jgi:hypothetical protein
MTKSKKTSVVLGAADQDKSSGKNGAGAHP